MIAQADPFGGSSVHPGALVDDLHVEGAQWTCGSEVVVCKAAAEERKLLGVVLRAVNIVLKVLMAVGLMWPRALEVPAVVCVLLPPVVRSVMVMFGTVAEEKVLVDDVLKIVGAVLGVLTKMDPIWPDTL